MIYDRYKYDVQNMILLDTVLVVTDRTVLVLVLLFRWQLSVHGWLFTGLIRLFLHTGTIAS